MNIIANAFPAVANTSRSKAVLALTFLLAWVMMVCKWEAWLQREFELEFEREIKAKSKAELTCPSLEAINSLSHKHLWSEHKAFVVNFLHSWCEAHCWPILTRLRQLLSCSMKFSKHWQAPSKQTLFLSNRTHCSFISHGWFSWTVFMMQRISSWLSMKLSSQTHLVVVRLQLEFGTSHGHLPSLLFTMTFWWFKVKALNF